MILKFLMIILNDQNIIFKNNLLDNYIYNIIFIDLCLIDFRLYLNAFFCYIK